MTTEVTSVGHIALRVTDLARARSFYTEALGFPVIRQNERACFVAIGGLLFVLLAGTEQTALEDRFDPFRVGLDHLALAVPAEALPDLKQRLDAAGVPNTGISMMIELARTRLRSTTRTLSPGSSSQVGADRAGRSR